MERCPGRFSLARALLLRRRTFAPGSEVTLEVGDAVYYDEGVVHQFRNPGSEPAVILEARLNPLDSAASNMATPASS